MHAYSTEESCTLTSQWMGMYSNFFSICGSILPNSHNLLCMQSVQSSCVRRRSLILGHKSLVQRGTGPKKVTGPSPLLLRRISFDQLGLGLWLGLVTFPTVTSALDQCPFRPVSSHQELI